MSDKTRFRMILWLALTQSGVLALAVCQSVVQIGYLPTLETLKNARVTCSKPVTNEKTKSEIFDGSFTVTTIADRNTDAVRR
jgi:hypothetical protein